MYFLNIIVVFFNIYSIYIFFFYEIYLFIIYVIVILINLSINIFLKNAPPQYFCILIIIDVPQMLLINLNLH